MSVNSAYDDSTKAMRVNIVSGGAAFISGSTTFTTGSPSGFFTDINGNLLVTLATKIAGEDLGNDWLKVQQGPFSYQALTSLVTVTVKTGSGVLHNIVVGGFSGPTINIWDNTTAATTLIGSLNANAPLGTYSFNQAFATGLTVQPLPGGGILPNINIGYK